MIPLTNDNSMLGYELLSLYPNMIHFVTTRLGGCSKSSYATFNCTGYTGDDPAMVEANQKILVNALNHKPTRLIIPKQVHGTEVRIIHSSAQTTNQALEGVDALITNTPGYCLCVSTADCVPILLYDWKENVIAAIHAGWRGTVQRIVCKTVGLMQQQYHTEAKNIIACIGPSISLDSFEVGDEVYESFRNNHFDLNQIARKHNQTGKYHIDLWEANKLQLLDLGVPSDQIECTGICSYKEYKTFFSARRMGINSGRTLSGIMII